MFKKILDSFLESGPVTWGLRVSKKFKPWGFEGLSLYYVMSYFFEGILKGALTTRAVAISYRLLLAIFPLLIVLIYLLSFIKIEDFEAELLGQLQAVFPGDTYSFLENSMDTLESLTSNKEEGGIISIIGFFLMLYYASNSINAILIGFDESYHMEEGNNWFIRRMLSIGLMFFLGLLLVIAVLLIMFSGQFFSYLENNELVPNHLLIIVLDIVKWAMVILIVYTAISTLYNVGNLKRKYWRFMTAGASFATLFFISGSIGFAYFINNLAQYDKLYGSLGSFLVLLIWINFNFIILLLGFELNTSIKKAKKLLRMKESQID